MKNDKNAETCDMLVDNNHNLLVWTPSSVLNCDKLPLLLGEEDCESSLRLNIPLSSLRHVFTSWSCGVPALLPINGWERICLLTMLPWTPALWLENATRLAAEESSSDSGTRGMEMEALFCSSRSFSSLSFISRFFSWEKTEVAKWPTISKHIPETARSSSEKMDSNVHLGGCKFSNAKHLYSTATNANNTFPWIWILHNTLWEDRAAYQRHLLTVPFPQYPFRMQYT